MRRELTQELGVGWEPITNGYADIDGVPRELIEAFSTRRAEILARLAERGESSARAAEVAALDTRRGKDHDVDVFGLVDRWRAKAAEFGFDRTELEQLLNRNLDPEPLDLAGTVPPHGVR